MPRLLSRTLRAAILAVGLGLLAAGPARGQSLWVEPGRGGLRLEFLKPMIDHTSTSSGVLYVGIRERLGPYMDFVGELPVAHGDVRTAGFDQTATTIGNPYLGLEIGPPSRIVTAEVGVRPALVDSVDAATSVGFLADVVDRPEAFLPDVVAVVGRVHARWYDLSGLGVLLHAGVVGWIPTDDSAAATQASYGARLGWRGPRADVTAGITGRVDLSDGFASIQDRSLNQVGAAASFRLGPVHPGVEVRVPLDRSLRDLVDWVLGFNLTLDLR